MNTFVTQTLEPRLTAADEYEREFTNQRPELATMIPSVYAEGEAKLALEEQSIFKYVKVMQDSLA
jgi:TorA maturation chaperone TorD